MICLDHPHGAQQNRNARRLTLTVCSRSRRSTGVRGQGQKPFAAAGFTLVEILVTLFILMLLAGIALPMTRNILKDQRNARATQILLSFIDSARNQAIAEGSEMGVIFDRMSDDGLGRSMSLRVRQLRGLPPYTGETAKAQVALVHFSRFSGPATEVNAARFDPIESQLLILSADILADSSLENDSTAPIQSGNRLELPGGRLLTIRAIERENPNDPLSPIYVGINPHEPVNRLYPETSRTYPLRSLSPADPPHRVRYAIHRNPLISNTRTVSLPRGTAIDFNYSGFGVRGNEFAPNLNDDSVAAAPISIFFDSKGRVSRVGDSAGNFGPPPGLIFFCVGDMDGVRPDGLFATERRSRANILRPSSTWIVLNPETGRVYAAPFAAVTPPGPNFTAADLSLAIEQSRRLANLGDTLE